MKQAVVFSSSIVLAFIFLSCHKSNSDDSSVLYGKWSKGANWGDTLYFYQKGDKNILAYNYSFNPAIPALTEVEYSCNQKLRIQFLGIPGSFKTIESFRWKQYGQKFEVQGIELYGFMSSTQVYFTYQKLQ